MGGALKQMRLPESDVERQFQQSIATTQKLATRGNEFVAEGMATKTEVKQATEYWNKFGAASNYLVNLGNTTRNEFEKMDKQAIEVLREKPLPMENALNIGTAGAVGVFGFIGKQIGEGLTLPARIVTAGVQEVAEHVESPTIKAIARADKRAMDTADSLFVPSYADIGQMFTGPSEMVERVNKAFEGVEAAHKEFRAAAKEMMGARKELMGAILSGDENKAEASAERLSGAVDRFKDSIKDLKQAMYFMTTQDVEEKDKLMTNYRGFEVEANKFAKELGVAMLTPFFAIGSAEVIQTVAPKAGAVVEKVMVSTRGLQRAAAATEKLAVEVEQIAGAARNVDKAVKAAREIKQVSNAVENVGKAAKVAKEAVHVERAAESARKVAAGVEKVGEKANSASDIKELANAASEAKEKRELAEQNGV